MTGTKTTDSITLRTTGAPYKIRLIADRTHIKADPNDLSYVTAEVIDVNGQVIPDAIVPVKFTAKGAGELFATGNANPKEPASFKIPQHNTFRGRCLAIIRAGSKAGAVNLQASAPGLVAGSITIVMK